MLCCIFNYAPIYRSSIYSKIAEEFNVHFYFGERLRYENINKIDFQNLKGFQYELKVNFYSFPIDWEWCKGMIQLAFDRRYNKYLITPNESAPNQWIFILFCRLLGKKVYVWEHGLKTKKIRKFWLWRSKFYHYLLSGSFIYGNKAKKNMIEMGYNGGKLHTIYNSLDYDLAIRYRKQLTNEPIYLDHFKNSDPILLFIGRLTPIKKLDMLINAHDILMQQGFKTNIVLIGDGDVYEELRQMVQDKRHSARYWFLGTVSEENLIAKLLYNATICISPGNVGLTAIHAFSYGLPVITNNNFETQMPEHEIIVDGINGAFFVENNIHSLVEIIKQWLLKKHDRESVRKLCYMPIDTFFNSSNQIKIFKKVLEDK